MSYKPLISIVIATYNSISTLSFALKSAISQTYPFKEIIIIDGGSTDGTQKVIESYSSHVKYWISESDRGIYDAWNKALLKTDGDWICFIGADDKFINNNILNCMAPILSLANLNKTRLIYFGIKKYNDNLDKYQLLGEEWEKSKDNFFKYQNIPHVGMMHHKSIFEQYGLFDPTFKIAGDYDLLIRVIKHESPMFEALIAYEMGNYGLSNNKSMQYLLLKENFRAKLKNRLNPFHFGLFKVIIYNLFTYFIKYISVKTPR